MDETAGIGVCPTATGSVTGGRSIVLVDGESVDERGTPIATTSGEVRFDYRTELYVSAPRTS